LLILYIMWFIMFFIMTFILCFIVLFLLCALCVLLLSLIAISLKEQLIHFSNLHCVDLFLNLIWILSLIVDIFSNYVFLYCLLEIFIIYFLISFYFYNSLLLKFFWIYRGFFAQNVYGFIIKIPADQDILFILPAF